jgi:hypothetical protein
MHGYSFLYKQEGVSRMKTRKTALALILMTVLAVTIYAQQYNPESDFGVKRVMVTRNSKTEEEIEITDYEGDTPDVRIPPRIQNLPVTRISIGAFPNDITSIVIPNSFTSIERQTFKNFAYLRSVTIPNSVTSIGFEAFGGCTRLTSITIPNNVTSIENMAFRNCTNLSSITIPDSVTSIGNLAFGGTAWFDKQPDGLVYMGKMAYKYKGTMPANTSITLLAGTKGIASSAFSSCTGLVSITIPDSVTSIGASVFINCSNLKIITVNASNSAYTVENSVLYNKNKTRLVVYPAGKSETTFTIPNSVTSIENYAFWKCTRLTSITVPNNVTSIGDFAFPDCSSLTSITIPNGVTSIGRQTFMNCTSLTRITIPNGITSIGQEAFAGCTNLASVTFQGTINSDDFNSTNSFPGDLRDKYLAGGIGTYTTTAPVGKNSVWMKQ